MATYQNIGLLYLNTDVRGSAIRDVFKPAAVEKNGYVYCVWNDYQGNTIIGKININNASGITQSQVAPRSDFSSDIEHATPTMCIDNNGYIYVFYGSHNSQQYYRKSSNPYDISTWSDKLSLTGATLATYPFPVVLNNNTIMVFWRQDALPNRHLYFSKTTNGGSTWATATKLIDVTTEDWVYIQSIEVGNEESNQSVHVLFALRDNTTGNFSNLSYLYSINEGSTWNDISGNSYNNSIDTDGLSSTGTIVIELATCHPADLKLTSENKPYIGYNNNKTYKSASYSTQWDITTIAAVAEYVYDHIEIDVISDTAIDAYLVDGTGTNIQGGDIERWRSTDSGATWSLAEQITNDANTGFRYYFPKVVRDSTGDIKLLYQGGIPRASYLKPIVSRLYTYPTATLQSISPDKNYYFDISAKTTEEKTTAQTKGRADYEEAHKNRHGVNIIQGEWSNDDLHYFLNTLGAVFYGDYEDGTIEE